MLFLIQCLDKPDAAELRLKTRPIHLEYLKSNKDKLLAAGAFMDDAEKVEGSVFLVEVADRKAAEGLVAGDPFTKAGLFQAVTIKRWRKAFFNFESFV
jgi:uncharacterized protein